EHELGRQPVAMKAHDAAIGDVLAEILLAAAATRAMAADHPGIERDRIARPAMSDARPDRGDLAGALDADDDRQLALGEGHAAEAPEVDVVEGYGLDAHDDLARAGRRRRRRVLEGEASVLDQAEGAHEGWMAR